MLRVHFIEMLDNHVDGRVVRSDGLPRGVIAGEHEEMNRFSEVVLGQTSWVTGHRSSPRLWMPFVWRTMIPVEHVLHIEASYT